MTEARKPRLDLLEVASDAYAALRTFDETVMIAAREVGIERAVLDLVKIRASQLNGCAFCLDMHSREARQEGESEQRLYVLAAWRDTPHFTARERAALALAEAVTSLHGGHVSDEVYRMAREVFNEGEVAHLILAATAINAWNRLSIATRLTPARARE